MGTERPKGKGRDTALSLSLFLSSSSSSSSSSRLRVLFLFCSTVGLLSLEMGEFLCCFFSLSLSHLYIDEEEDGTTTIDGQGKYKI